MTYAHLKALYRAASPLDVQDGLAAFIGYRETMGRFAGHYGFPIETTTAAFVALSPNSEFLGNLRSLSSCMAGVRAGLADDAVTVTTFKGCRNRAMSYLRGDVDFWATAKGPKIRAFYDNILNPTASRAVTVDGHMIAAWVGDPRMTMKAAAQYMAKARNFDRIAGDISRLADAEGIAPCQAQAVLWMARKRINGIAHQTNAEMFDRTTPEHCPPYKTNIRPPVISSVPIIAPGAGRDLPACFCLL